MKWLLFLDGWKDFQIYAKIQLERISAFSFSIYNWDGIGENKKPLGIHI